MFGTEKKLCYVCVALVDKDHTCPPREEIESKGPYLTADACPSRWGKEQDPYVGAGIRD